MSKSQLGGGALFFLALAANFLPVSGPERVFLCFLSLIGAAVFLVGFLRADHPGKEAEQQGKLEKRRVAREALLDCCTSLLNSSKPYLAFNALSKCKGYKLENNQDLIWVCDELVKKDHGHPFGDLDYFFPQSDWLKFLRWVNGHSNYDATKGVDYLDAAEKWRQEHGYREPPDSIHVTHIFRKKMSQEGE